MKEYFLHFPQSLVMFFAVLEEFADDNFKFN